MEGQGKAVTDLADLYGPERAVRVVSDLPRRDHALRHHLARRTDPDVAGVEPPVLCPGLSKTVHQCQAVEIKGQAVAVDDIRQ